MVIGITFGAVTIQAIEARYTLSLGISPSICTVRIPATTGIPTSVMDLKFTEGGNELTLKECRLGSTPADRSLSGQFMVLNFQDRRWLWKYGYLNGEYNFGRHEGHEPLTGTEEFNYKKTARELADLCFEAMAEIGPDYSALPDNDYPYVNWDYANPAEALAELCDKYGCVVAYNPFDGDKVKIVVRGEGNTINKNLMPYDSYSEDIVPAQKPFALLGVCEHDEHEVELDLEAVGLDMDGKTKILTELSYYPAAGFTDETEFSDVGESGRADQEQEQVIARKSVFKWYRVKSPQSIPKWKDKSSVKMPELLPISERRIMMAEETNEDGTKREVRQEAYCKGIFAQELRTVDTLGNTTVGEIVPENFSVRGAAGIIEFSRPIFKVGTDKLEGATLKLRTTIWGPRYEKRYHMGGSQVGCIVPVQINGVARQFIYTADDYAGDPMDNSAAVEAKVDAILEKYSKQYEDVKSANIHYVGIMAISVDGRLQQVTYEIGPSGAYTTVSESTEHSWRIQDMDSRREREQSNRRLIDTGKPDNYEPSDFTNYRQLQYKVRGD